MAKKELESDETDLVAKWYVADGRVVGDETADRIDWLIAHTLMELETTPDGWSTLFRDPGDGRLWERTYPQSEMHGGGPLRLTCISEDRAREKYHL